jgi:hypothetical protein
VTQYFPESYKPFKIDTIPPKRATEIDSIFLPESNRSAETVVIFPSKATGPQRLNNMIGWRVRSTRIPGICGVLKINKVK